MLPPLRRLAGPLALAGALGALFSAGAARAQVSVLAAPVTFTGGLFNYSYSVTNITASDLLIVNLNSLPMVPGALANLTAPTGFKISSYDPGVGIESFLADTQAFTPGSTISGFSFTSAFGPGAVPFDAQDAAGGTSAGTTVGPSAAAPVPEAGTLVSLGAGVLLLTLCAVRRRRAAPAVSHS